MKRGREILAGAIDSENEKYFLGSKYENI